MQLEVWLAGDLAAAGPEVLGLRVELTVGLVVVVRPAAAVGPVISGFVTFWLRKIEAMCCEGLFDLRKHIWRVGWRRDGTW